MADAPTDPEVPAAPSAAEKGTPEYTRRQFLGLLSAGVGALGAVLVAIPFVSFLLAPLLKQPEQVWRAVGASSTFKIGETVEVAFQDPSPLPYAGVSAQTAAWLRRESETTFRAFAVNCTHLGCPVQWLPDGKLFLCPCHGGVYYEDGQVAAGPPPHPLPQYEVRVNAAGQVEIRTQRVPIA
ncbi:MAG TPA: ubiquinol-cytochrome c reductase iron-sulfur subunit [Chloroflexia bacterium]|nr:ubiquinol-cytochrome c reductase iron-sulfur subunit [Chloroflexia bacterium]